MKKTVIPKDPLANLDLTAEERERMKEQFLLADRQKSGSINNFDLKSLFEAVGEYPNAEKMQQVISMTEEKAGSHKVDLNLALFAWSYLKELMLKEEEDDVDIDILNTFVAMGGNIDKTGSIKKDKLIHIIKDQFELKIDIEQMFEEAGIDVENELSYYDLVCLMEYKSPQREKQISTIFSVASLA